MWHCQNRTDPQNKVIMSFIPHVEVHKLEIPKIMAQLDFFPHSPPIIFLGCPSTLYGTLNTAMSMEKLKMYGSWKGMIKKELTLVSEIVVRNGLICMGPQVFHDICWYSISEARRMRFDINMSFNCSHGRSAIFLLSHWDKPTNLTGSIYGGIKPLFHMYDLLSQLL